MDINIGNNHSNRIINVIYNSNYNSTIDHIDLNDMINIDMMLGTHLNINNEDRFSSFDQDLELGLQPDLDQNLESGLQSELDQDLESGLDQELDQELDQDLEGQNTDQEEQYQYQVLEVESAINITLEEITEEIDEIIRNMYINSPIIDDNIQENIHRTDISIRTTFFDLIDLNETFDKLFMMHVVKGGLNTGYEIKIIIENLYYYYLINYDNTDFDSIMNIFKEVCTPIIYRNRRQNIFFRNILNTFTNIFGLQRLGEEPDTNPSIDNDIFDKKFKTFKYQDLDNCATDCAICKLEYDKDTEITMLPCSTIVSEAKDHYFHTDCIKTWMTNYHSNCPVCKTCHKHG